MQPMSGPRRMLKWGRLSVGSGSSAPIQTEPAPSHLCVHGTSGPRAFTPNTLPQAIRLAPETGRSSSRRWQIAQMKRQKARIRTGRALTPRSQGGLGSRPCVIVSSAPSSDTTAISGSILLLRLLPDPTTTVGQPGRPSTSRVRRWKDPSLTRPPNEGGYGTFRPTSKADLVLGGEMDEGSMHSPRSDLV